MKECKRHAAIVLAAGKGSRMKSDVPKQYLSLKGKPVLYYALKAFEDSFIDEIVLVTGICALDDADYVYIHVGARPFIDNALLCRARDTVQQYHACAAGMTSKDTIKLINEQGFVRETPERKYTWIIQTPQVFEYTLIRGAYEKMYQNMPAVQITDDAMVVETMLCTPVKLYEGSYDNIKITTPEDMVVAEAFLNAE